jgi:biopolymer transport protein ExbB/TolQ
MNFISAFSHAGLVLNLVFAMLIFMSCLSWYVIGLKAFKIFNEYRTFNRFVIQHAKQKDWARRPDLSDFLNGVINKNTREDQVIQDAKLFKNKNLVGEPEFTSSQKAQYETKFDHSSNLNKHKNQTSGLYLLLSEAFNCCKITKNLDSSDNKPSQSQENQKHHEIITMHLLQALDEIRFQLDHGLTILASIGSCAPFVGLFGTVWGIYHALGNISSSGNAGLSVVAGPIGEALVATAVGLFAAIPAVLAYNSFVRLNRILVQNLRHLAEQLEIYL